MFWFFLSLLQTSLFSSSAEYRSLGWEVLRPADACYIITAASEARNDGDIIERKAAAGEERIASSFISLVMRVLCTNEALLSIIHSPPGAILWTRCHLEPVIGKRIRQCAIHVQVLLLSEYENYRSDDSRRPTSASPWYRCIFSSIDFNSTYILQSIYKLNICCY